MRLICLSITLTLLMITLNTVAAPLQLDVMSFNIRMPSMSDGDNHWNHRKEMVVRVIERYKPMVFGVQECVPEQGAYLETALFDYACFGVGREPGLRGEGVNIFYRRNDIAILEAGNYWLSETPDEIASMSWDTACRRMVTWAKCYHKKSKRVFYYANTHLDHKSKAAREGGSALIAKRSEVFSEGFPVVVTGDFNAQAGKSVPWDNFINAGFKDAWVEADMTLGSTTTWSGFKAPEPNRDRRIDWILFKGEAEVELCETVNYNEDGRYPSDHFPVFAKLTFAE